MQTNQDQKGQQITNPVAQIQVQPLFNPQQSLKSDLQMQEVIVPQSNQNYQQILESQQEVQPRKREPENIVPFENHMNFQEEISQKPMNDAIDINTRNDEGGQDEDVKQDQGQMCQNIGEIEMNYSQCQVYEQNPPMQVQDPHVIDTAQNQKDRLEIQVNILGQNQHFETCGNFQQESSQKYTNDIFESNFINEEVKQHERKLSQDYQPIVLNLDIHKSTTRKSQISSRLDYLTQRQASVGVQTSNLNSSYDDVLQIEQPKQPLSIYKRTPISNCFANRSQRSHRSHSNESRSSSSSYRYNRFVDTMQVPQITSLQIVKNGRESKVQRRNSINSYHGRSASTCKKSYEDFGDFHMQKIDQSACEEVDEKSVKRSVANPTKSKILMCTNTLNQQSELQNQFSTNIQDSQILEKPHIEEYVYSKYIKSQRQKSQFRNTFPFDGLTSNEQFSSFNQPSIKIENQIKCVELRSKICHQVSFKYGDQNQLIEVQFDNKSIQVDNEVSQFSNKITESKRIKEQNQRKAIQRQIRIQKHFITPIYNICIQSGLQKTQRFNKMVDFCREFIESSQNLSHFGRSRYKEMLQNHFEVFGIELNPIDETGDMLYHDGLFATSYISFVKGSKNNSGMIESMLYSQFEQQIHIITNKEPFSRQYKRVKQERQMHYQNQFEKRIRIYEENKQKEKEQRLNKLQLRMTQIQKQMDHPQKRVVLHDKKVDTKELENTSLIVRSPLAQKYRIPELNSESNISVAGSNGTVTVDDTIDRFQTSIRRSATIELPKAGQPIFHQNEHINRNTQEIDRMNSSLLTKEILKQEEHKKVQKSKRRSTKRKQKKSQSKEQQSIQIVEQTISQVNPLSKIQISKPRMSRQWKQSKKNQEGTQSFKQMKGILKISRKKKDEQTERGKRKSSNRFSVNKTQKSKLSPQQKRYNSKNSGVKVEKSKQKQQENQRQKNKTKSSTDIDDSDLFDSNSHKISMQKLKKHQNRIVKFTNSTKGGNSPYVSRLRDDSQNREKQEDNKGEIELGKRSLRSRSKK